MQPPDRARIIYMGMDSDICFVSVIIVVTSFYIFLYSKIMIPEHYIILSAIMKPGDPAGCLDKT